MSESRARGMSNSSSDCVIWSLAMDIGSGNPDPHPVESSGSDGDDTGRGPSFASGVGLQKLNINTSFKLSEEDAPPPKKNE